MKIITLKRLADDPVEISLKDFAPLQLTPGSEFAIRVSLTPTGERIITWSRAHPLNLTYRWADEREKVVESNGLRTSLCVPALKPGALIESELKGIAPDQEGSFTLQVSLVLEGIEWALDTSPTGWLKVPVRVGPPPKWPLNLQNSCGARAIRGALAAAQLASELEQRGFSMREADGYLEARTSSVDLTEAVAGSTDAPGVTKDHAVATMDRSLRQQSRLASLLAENRHLEQQVRQLENELRKARRQARGDTLAATSRKLQIALVNGLAELQVRLRALEATHRSAQISLDHSTATRELLSSMRQLVDWTQVTGDQGFLGEINSIVLRADKRIEALAKSDAEQRAIADQRHVRTEQMLHELLTRQVITVPATALALVRNYYGLLAVPDDDLTIIAYYSSGILPEPGTIALVDALLGAGDCFLDAGANVGIYSLIAGRKVGHGGAVIAVEPATRTNQALRATIAVNGLTDVVESHACALGAASGSAMLHFDETSGRNSLLDTGRDLGSEVVAIKRGDELLAGRRPTLIKVDVEGWGLDVLEGLRPILNESSETRCIVEYSPEHIGRRGLTHAEWLQRLRAFDLQIWRIDDHAVAIRPLGQEEDLGSEVTNLLLGRTLPSRLEPMLHAG